jgi:hypothetical protein
MKFKKAENKNNDLQDQQRDLLKLKKKDLLEIMLEQGKEIDRLNAKVAELENELSVRAFDFQRIGSLAEASLYITDIFKEADKAALTYLQNIRRKHEQSGEDSE